MNTSIATVLTGILLVGSVAIGFAQGQAMSEEQQAMMGKMKEYTTPNEHHDVLKALAGSWKTTVKFWMDPQGEPQESQGTSESKMILGGRFLEQNFQGTAMGQPFEGRGIMGYDNMRQEYTSLWFDNMATGIMVSAAKYDPKAKTFTEEGSMSCPITNEKHRWFRGVMTLVDNNHYSYETFMKDKDGKEFRSMVITYARVK